MTAVVVPHNFDQINSEILGPSCAAFSVCHSGQGQHDANMLNLAATNLDGTPNDPYVALVNAAAQNMKAHGEGQLRVKPCDSAHSFTLFKLTLATNEDPLTGYGHYMPDT
ncbi:MAG: hypothetical protein JWM53_2943, partial [bacterium]|nr:hypothetical protein [bacterium]